MSISVNLTRPVVYKAQRVNLYTSKDDWSGIQKLDLFYDYKTGIIYQYLIDNGFTPLSKSEQDDIQKGIERLLGITNTYETGEETLKNLTKPDTEENIKSKIEVFEEALKKPCVRSWDVIEPGSLVYTVNNSNHWCNPNNQASMDQMYKLTESYPEVRLAILEKLNLTEV